MRRTNQIKNLTIRRRKSDQNKNEVISKIDDVLENGESGFTLTEEGKKLLKLCKQEIMNLNKEVEKSQKENERMVSEIETLEEAILCPICYDNYVNLQPGKSHLSRSLVNRDLNWTVHGRRNWRSNQLKLDGHISNSPTKSERSLKMDLLEIKKGPSTFILLVRPLLSFNAFEPSTFSRITVHFRTRPSTLVKMTV